MRFCQLIRLLSIVFLLWAFPCWAGPGIVQCTALSSSIVNSTTSKTTPAFGSTPIVNNYIVVMASMVQLGGTGTGVTSITDNQGNTYAVDINQPRSDSLVWAAIGSGKATTSSGSFTVTAHFLSEANQALDLMACEMSSPAATSQLDKTGHNEVNPGTTVTVTASGANGNANDAVFTVSAGSTPSATPTTGYTLAWTDSTNVGSNAGYKIVGSIETSAATTSFASTDQIAVIATYKGTAGGGGSTNSPLTLLGVGP
jgi:hypothetical protein